MAEEVGPSADVEGGIAFEMSGVNGMTTNLLTNAHTDPDGRFSHSPLRLAGMLAPEGHAVILDLRHKNEGSEAGSLAN